MTEQTIFRVRKQTHYTVISNYPLNDENLSPEALGVLNYLLSKPDDWIVYNGQVQKRFSIGRKKLDRILSNLKQAGYIQRQRRRGVSGNFYYETVVSEVPLSLLGTTEYPTVVPLSVNGSSVNGSSVNGSSVNGSSVNGSSVNGKGDDIPNTDSPNTDLPIPERVIPEGGDTPTVAPTGAPDNDDAVKIFSEVTKIKKAKIPEAVLQWLKNWNEKGFAPDFMRQAIVKADTHGEVFKVEQLDEYYSRLDPYSWRLGDFVFNYSYKKDKVTGVNHLVVNDDTHIPVEDLPGITQRKIFEAAVRYHAEWYKENGKK